MRLYYNLIMEALSGVNNVVQFIGFVVAAFALVFIFSYSRAKPLFYLFCRIGLRMPMVLKVLWLCRKNPTIDLRVFCEYCIIFSEGRYCHGEDWKKLYREFYAFFSRCGDGAHVIEICDATPLLSEKVSEMIKKYFDYFSSDGMRKVYKISSDEPMRFCAKIKIVEGFLSPNILLTGLISRYDENWHTLIQKYISACQSNDNDILPHELYFTFAWLLWGPSYQIREQELYNKICQYAFGDENNSVHVVLDNQGGFDELWQKISQGVSSGLLCSIVCTLYDPKDYIRFFRDRFNPRQPYFINKLADGNGASCLLGAEECEERTGYMHENYYCTAYLWIMFEVIGDNEKFFAPQRSITFFEHANLASPGNYDFLIDALLNKVFMHFDSVFSDKRYSGRRYRFCMAMNKLIETLFFENLQNKILSSDKGAYYKNNIVKEPLYAAGDIFSAMDSYFSDISVEQQYIEVSSDDKESLKCLGEFYTSVYIEEFPNPNERESLDNILEYLNMKNKGWYGSNNYHVLLLKSAGMVLAGVIFDYFEASNCGVIEFIAVRRDSQSLKLGSKMYGAAIEIMNRDAFRARGRQMDYCICEIENPDCLTESASTKYIYFWDKLGYRQLDFPYVQPALEAGKEAVESLILVALPVRAGSAEELSAMDAQKLKSFIHDYAKYAMRIDAPDENGTIRNMYLWLKQNAPKAVKLKRILPEGRLVR